MVPPIPKILNKGGSSMGGICGAITITSTERVNNWNQKILKKFRKLVNNSEEEVLNHLVEDYYRLVKDQLTYLKERHLLRDKISDHLYSLHLSYVRLQEQELIKTSVYMDTMEKLLCLVCDLELEVVSLTKQKTMTLVTQGIINMLHIYLHDCITRILHVLLKLSERYLNRQPYKLIMNIVYKYFLITIPILNTTDLNFCLHYLIYQKWKKTKAESAQAAMDKVMYFTFNRTPDYIKKSKFLCKILRPHSSEVITIIDDYVNGVEGRITRYFKYYEQTKEVLNNNRIENDNCSKSRKNYDPYEIEFVQSMLYIKTLTIRNKADDTETLIGMVGQRDEIVVIEDDDDSDVEIVPLVENDTAVTPETAVTMENPLFAKAVTDSQNAKPVTDASKLVPLFDSISIATIKDVPSEKEDLSFSDWVFNNNDKSEKGLEIIKFLQSVLDEFSSKAQNNDKQYIVPNAFSKQYSSAQKLDISKLKAKANSTDKYQSIKTHSNMITQHEETSDEQNSEESHTKNVVLKEVQNTKIVANDRNNSEVQTNRNTCSCDCKSSKNMIQNTDSKSEEIQTFREVPYRNVEIQTDSGITVTNVSSFRDGIETPPSDLENCINSPNTAFAFIPSFNEYVKEDNFNGSAELYNETGGITLKLGDCTTQVYSDIIVQGVTQEDLIKTQDEAFDCFNYNAATSSAAIENEYPRNLHNELETESHILLVNNSSTVVDDNNSLKIPLLEPEVDGIDVTAAEHKNGNECSTSVTSEACFVINNTTTTITNRKVVAAVDVKKRVGRKDKNKSHKVKKNINPTYPLSEFDKFTSHPNVIADTYGVQSLDTQDISDNLDTSDNSKNKYDQPGRDLSPSPAYEVISTSELRKHFREVKKGKKAGILKTSNTYGKHSGNFSNSGSSVVQNDDNISLLRSPISTRASTKRKHKTTHEDTAHKTKRVNFSETDTIVHYVKEQQRRISHYIAEQAKDSMCINNIHKQDNKLFYLEPLIPINIMPFSKFLEEHKLRQINTYSKNVNNRFFNATISIKDSTVRPTLQRVDYKKTNDNAVSNSPKYSTITFDTSRTLANSSAGDIESNIMDCSDAEQCDAGQIIQNALNLFTNANLSYNLNFPLCINTYKSLTKYLLQFDSENTLDISISKISKIEVRIPHNQSSYEKYQEKEMPIKKRRVPTSSSYEEHDATEDHTYSDNSFAFDRKFTIKTNHIFPPNIELFLILKNGKENSNDTVPASVENYTQNNVNDSILSNSQNYLDVNYPPGRVISIAEVQENERIQNRSFKTPAERKEFPVASTYCYPHEPNTIFPESSAPIIADQFNVNNHTYNNPTINYHMNNIPLPYYSYYTVPSYILPYNTVPLDASTTSSNPISYNDIVKQNAAFDNGQSSCRIIKKETAKH